MKYMKTRAFRTVSIFAMIVTIIVGVLAGPEIARASTASSSAGLSTAIEAQPAQSIAMSAAMLKPDGIYKLLETIRLIIIFLGGDPGDAPANVNDRMVYAETMFYNQGFLPNLTQQEIAEALQAIDDAEEVLETVPLPTGIDPDIAADFLLALDDMRDDLD